MADSKMKTKKQKKRWSELKVAAKTGDPKKLVRATCRYLASDEKAIKEIVEEYLSFELGEQ